MTVDRPASYEVQDKQPQHPGYQTLRAAADGTLRAVVEHHQPHPVMSSYEPTRVAYWQCCGCDPGPRPEDYADWPCTTAMLIAEQLAIPLDENARAATHSPTSTAGVAR